jgi:hypothetical protein
VPLVERVADVNGADYAGIGWRPSVIKTSLRALASFMKRIMKTQIFHHAKI